MKLGYNSFEIDIPIMVKKGAFVVIDTSLSFGAISIDPRGMAIYSDYQIINSELFPLDVSINKRLYFSSLISKPFYDQNYTFTYKYPQIGTYFLLARYLNTDSYVNRSITITNSNKINYCLELLVDV